MFFNEEDFIELDESDFVDTPTTEEDTSNVETPVEQTSETEVKTEQQGLTKEQVLEFMNSQGMKYNGESVKIENFDDLVSTYQKGLNYDKVKAKADADKDNDDVLSYITSKAQSMGISAKEYIQKVKNYEAEQAKAQIENDVQNMVNNGVPEEVARRVANVEARMKDLDTREAQLTKERQEAEAQKNKDKEYEDFLKEYSEVKAEDIPAEVFENAKTMGLRSAYAEYENKLLKQQIKQMEQNKNNASSSVVSATSDGSNTEQESKDAFLMGFDS